MKYALMALGLAAAVSVFLYGAFGVEWWAPIHPSEVMRSFVLMVAHVVAMLGGVVAAGVHYENKDKP